MNALISGILDFIWGKLSAAFAKWLAWRASVKVITDRAQAAREKTEAAQTVEERNEAAKNDLRRP